MTTPPADPMRNGGWSAEHDALAKAAGHESWRAWTAITGAQKGHKVCGGRNCKDEPCSQPAGVRTAHRGRGRCKWHGGGSLSGPANPAYIDGRTIDWIPGGLAAAYGHAMSDPDLLSLRRKLAMAEARWEQLMARLGTGETASAWREAGSAFRSLKAAVNAGDVAALKDALTRLGGLIEHGAEAGRAWAEIRETEEHVRKLAATEVKRIRVAHEAITRERLTGLLAVLVETLRRAAAAHITDETARRALLAEVAGEVRSLMRGRESAGLD